MLKNRKHRLKSGSVGEKKKKRLKKQKIEEFEEDEGDVSTESKYPPELIAEDEDSEIKAIADEGQVQFTEKSDSSEYEKYFKLDLKDDQVTELNNKYSVKTSLSWEVLHRILVMSRSNDKDLKQLNEPLKKLDDSDDLCKNYGISSGLSANWFAHVKNNGFSVLQKEIFTILHQYRSLYYPCSSSDDEDDIRKLYCLHALNHVVQGRACVVKNNRRLSKLNELELATAEYRDQGFTRPKVLILVPFREHCVEIVSTFIKLLKTEKKFDVSGLKRFQEEYVVADEEEEIKELDADMARKPLDYQRTFKGNTDEHFRLGISLLGGVLRLYAPFYSSDIIIASPVGLRSVLGEKGEDHYEHDFLSSIEMFIMDNSDVFLMQNWEHVIHIVKHLHLQPKESHDVDFSRVRSSTLNGHAKHYCQAIVFSSISMPHISSVVTKYCFNYKGLICVQNITEKGTICGVTQPVPQIYHKLVITSQPFGEVQNLRFEFFTKNLLKHFMEKKMEHILIYIPQYFDYVRLRNYMRRESKFSSLNFACICEYVKPRALKLSRKKFLSGEATILLYTERYHFYNRPKLKGVENLLFYELPTYPQFYSELCNSVQVSNEGAVASNSILSIYSKYDSSKLTAVLGNTRTDELLKSQKKVHMFLTENNA